MSKTKIKTERVSGFRIAVMVFCMFLLSIIMAFSMILGISLLKSSGPLKGLSDDATTVRKALPKEGTLPTDVDALDNIGFMATVMDNQPYYHSYARNSTKSSGYTQITQSWKDYKSAKVSGEGHSVMVATDLSFSGLIKSATQSCFIGSEKALIRSGGKPSSTGTTPLDIAWPTGEPTVYDKNGYKYVYGEFSTEISVYIINKDTFEKADDVEVVGDGIYKQKYYLNEYGGYWYQYGMKTRGGLKSYPKFKSIEITFTFNDKWEILESYCEEIATINPKALGGMDMKSRSETTTVYDYTEEGFATVNADYNLTRGNKADNQNETFDCAEHYAYYDNYFKQYKDLKPNGGGTVDSGEPDAISVLTTGLKKAISGEGQQFNISSITIGGTDYDGKLYLCLDMNADDIVGSVDVRVALSKKGSNAQDLYIEFANRTVNVYYSTNFALTANIDEVSDAINEISKLIKEKFENSTSSATPVKHSLTDEEAGEDSGGLDLSSLGLRLELTDTEAVVVLESDDLLGFGIGIDAVLSFARSGANGDVFDIKSINLNSISYDETPINLAASIGPDNGTPITRNAPQTPANLADYIDSVYKILNSKTVRVELGLNGDFIEGLDLHAIAYVLIGSNIATNVTVSAKLDGVSLTIEANYKHVGKYGQIYLHVTEINGEKANGKVYCDIDATRIAVETIIKIFKDNSGSGESGIQTISDEGTSETVSTLASIINKVLNLNFGRILQNVSANEEEISLAINVDEILNGLDVDLGFDLGELSLKFINSENPSFSGGLSGLGLTLDVAGSRDDLAEIEDPESYIDIELLMQFAEDVISKGIELAESRDIAFNLNVESKYTENNKQDNIEIEVNGQVVWGEDGVQVEVSLNLSVDNDDLLIDLVYDGSVTDNSVPFIFVQLSDKTHGLLATKVSKNDWSAFVDSFKDLINAFNGTGSADGSDDGESPVALTAASGYALNVGGVSVSELLTSDAVQSVLKLVFNFISEFALKVDTNTENDVTTVVNLLIKHSSGLNLSVDANDGLHLELAKAEKFSLSATAKKGVNGKDNISTKRDQLQKNGDGKKFVEFYELIKALYDDFFGYNLDDKLLNRLFGETYAIELDLIGANSAIEALEPVKVHATLYYGEGIVDDTLGTKLLHIALNITINKTTDIVASVSYGGDMIYIALDRIGSTNLEGIKFSASVDSIGDAVEQLIKIVTDTNLVETINKIKGNGTGNGSSENDAEAIALFAETLNDDNGTSKSTLQKVLEAIISLKIKTYKQGSSQHISINVDSLAESLLGVKIGDIEAEYDSDKKVLTASAELDGKTWLNLSVGSCEKRTDVINPSDYMDISFISTLLSDITNTATNADGEIYILYTFAGNIKISVSIPLYSFDITFENATLTVGLDENGEIYVSLAAHLTAKKILFGAITVSEDRNISITYSNGLIVLGREVGSDKEIYKVITLEYLLDNIGDKENSPVRWLLGTDSGVWGAIFDAIGLDISSGLTKPQIYELYAALATTSADGEFNLSNYLSGLYVKADGKELSSYGNGAADAISKLGLKNSDNYYAFDINSKSLVGSTIPTLYAALTRDKNGISGIKAYGEVSSYLSFTIDLNNYLEGVTAVYDGTNELGKVAARNYLIYVTDKYKFNKDDGDYASGDAHTTPTFGCFNSEDVGVEGKNPYVASYVLDTVYLYVYGLDGSLERTVELRYGSTVKLIREGFPEFTDENKTHKLIYTDKDGVDLGSEIVLDDSILEDGMYSVYKAELPDKTVEVEFHFIDALDNKDIIAAQSFAFVGGEGLIEYSQGGYTFLGWYTEDSFETLIDTVPKDIDKLVVYGKYIKTVYDAENGVRYTFDANLYDPDGKTEGKGGYYVSGTNRNISGYYNNDNLWLEIEPEINGYRVYYISANAFARAEGDTNSLVNVVIPESIIAIYDNAFAYNTGLKKVIIFGDEVFIGGGASSGMGTTSVFYGCYPTKGNNDGLTVYFNKTRGENPYKDYISTKSETLDKEWHRIYFGSREGAWFADLIYYLVAKSTCADYSNITYMYYEPWLLADYSVNFDALSEYPYLANLNLADFNLSSGFGSTEYSIDDIRNLVLEKINSLTAENGQFINGFNVYVTINGKDTSKVAFGKYSEISITIVEETSTRAYLVNFHDNYNDEAAEISNKEDLIVFNGKTYALAGETYYITIKGIYEFSSASGIEVKFEDGRYYFIMLSEPVEIDIVCVKPDFTVTLLSEYDFTYKGDVKGYNTSDDGTFKYTAEISNPESLAGAEVKEGNYVFIGWAYSVGDSYVFESSSVNYSTYYAIWAFKRDEISTLTASGLTLTAEVDSSKANSVYGWYYDDKFTGDVVANCEDNVASFVVDTPLTSTTLYARMVFTLTYYMGKNGISEDCYYYVMEDKDTNPSSGSKQTNGVYSSSLKILEGETIIYSWQEENVVFKIEYVNESKVSKSVFFRIKYKKIISQSSCKYDLYDNSDASGDNINAKGNSEMTVDGNLTLYMQATSKA